MITQIEIVWAIKLKKQTIVVEDSLSKNQAAIDFIGDNVLLLEWYKLWDLVTVSFVMRVNMSGNIFNRVSGSTIVRHSWPDDV